MDDGNDDDTDDDTDDDHDDDTDDDNDHKNDSFRLADQSLLKIRSLYWKKYVYDRYTFYVRILFW